jgi:Branched-chain amino acid transport system / permease component
MSTTLAILFSIGFHGLALAMVLYLISVGLSVTMGMMGFVNLAHGVFAMLGGYVMTGLMQRHGASLPLAMVAAAAAALVSLPIERLLYRRLYGGRRARPGAADDGARLHLGPGRALSARPGAAAARTPDRAQSRPQPRLCRRSGL